MHTDAVQYNMKDVGYRLRRSAIVRGFMELAVMAVGDAVAAVVSALWPSLCLPSTSRLAAAGRHGLGQYVGKVHARYRRGIGLQSAAMAERRAAGGARAAAASKS